jgi:hypothetical protein
VVRVDGGLGCESEVALLVCVLSFFAKSQKKKRITMNPTVLFFIPHLSFVCEKNNIPQTDALKMCRLSNILYTGHQAKSKGFLTFFPRSTITYHSHCDKCMGH